MKELGNRLSELRKASGVTLDEASHDLGINVVELENLEQGNVKAFKDVYELRNSIKSYAKYLGLNEVNTIDEFNDYLFEKTSKISLDDIKASLKKEDKKEDRISSPYTKIKHTRYDYAPIVLTVVLLVFISLIVYLVLAFLRDDGEINRELDSCNKMEEVYEFAK